MNIKVYKGIKLNILLGMRLPTQNKISRCVEPTHKIHGYLKSLHPLIG